MAANIIPSNKPSIYDQLKLTSGALDANGAARAIVRPNNPPAGIGGYLFDIDMDAEIVVNSDITDHYTEQNNPINDNWAVKPEEITLTGLVAELIQYAVPAPASQSPVPDPVPVIPGYPPELTPQAQQDDDQTVATATLTSDAVASSQSIYGYFVDKGDKDQIRTTQAIVFAYFYQVILGRQLVSVETPWGTMTDMALINCRTRQGPDSKSVTDFSLTFKKIRYVDDITINPGQLAGRVAAQRAPVTQKGDVGKTPLTPAQSQSWIVSGLKFINVLP